MDIFPFHRLCDDLVAVIFGFLTIKQLVAIEPVSKKWNGNVGEALRSFTKIVVQGHREIRFCEHFCLYPEHHFHSQDLITIADKASHIAGLIRKLPNLRAVHLGGDAFDDNVTEALAECPQLTHLEVLAYLPHSILNLDVSRITCLGRPDDIELLSPELWTKLEFIRGTPVKSEFPEIIKSGLRGVTLTVPSREEIGLLVLEHGRRLEVLNLTTFAYHGDFSFFDGEQIIHICRQFKQLREFRLLGLQHIKHLNYASNLETLHWDMDCVEDFELGVAGGSFEHYLSKITFGHRLKKLVLESQIPKTGDLIGQVAKFCPNLNTLVCKPQWWFRLASSEVVHPRLRTFFVSVLVSTEVEFRALLNQLPELRHFTVAILRISSSIIGGVHEWNHRVQHDFPKIRVEFSQVFGM